MFVDDPGNGLLLFKPFEWAFDNSKLCFVYDPGFDHFAVHFLDPSLASMKLIDFFSNPQSDRIRDLWSTLDQNEIGYLKSQIGDRTFGEFQGRWLVFSGHSIPFKRALCFHTKRAVSYARDQGWLKKGQTLPFNEDFWSEGDYKEKVQSWMAKI